MIIKIRKRQFLVQSKDPKKPLSKKMIGERSVVAVPVHKHKHRRSQWWYKNSQTGGVMTMRRSSMTSSQQQSCLNWIVELQFRLINRRRKMLMTSMGWLTILLDSKLLRDRRFLHFLIHHNNTYHSRLQFQVANASHCILAGQPYRKAWHKVPFIHLVVQS